MASPRGQTQEQQSLAFGAMVSQLRQERGKSLKAIADLVPMSDSNLSRLERGKQGPPSDEVIERLAAALEADPAELLRGAGRVAGESSFEQFVRSQLRTISHDLEEIKATVTKLLPD